MAERRPSMKRPGVTATGRQWQVIEALRADGWLVLEVDPIRWSDAEAERVRIGLEDRDEHLRATQGVFDSIEDDRREFERRMP